MPILIRYHHVLLLVLFLLYQTVGALHELDFDNPDHLGHVQCQLCMHSSGVDLAPFETAVKISQVFLFSESAKSPAVVSPETIYFSPYRSRAPPRAHSFI